MSTHLDTSRHEYNEAPGDLFRLPGDPRLWTALVLGAIAVLALALRLVDLQASLWSDEIRTYEGASLPFLETLMHKPYPLYFILAHGALFFGDTEALLRLPSVLAGVAGVLALYGLGKSVSGRVTGLVAALLLAVWPYHIAYSHEARFYALLMLGGILLLWALHRALRAGGWGNWALVAGVTALTLLTHLFAVPCVAMVFLGAVLWLLVAQRHHWRQWASLLIAALVGLAPFLALNAALGGLPTTLIEVEDSQDTTQAQAPVAEAVSQETGIQLSPVQYLGFLRGYLAYQPPYALAAMGVLAALGLAWLGWRQRDVAAMVLALLVLLPLPFFAISTTHFYDSRYFSMLLPVLLLLVAIGATQTAQGIAHWIGRRSRIVAEPLAALIIVALLAILAPSVHAGIRSEYGRRAYDPWMGDWKGAAAYMATYLQPRDVVIHAIPEDRQWELTYPLDFYMRRSMPNSGVVLNSLQYFHGLPDETQLAQVLEQFQERNIWVVSKGESDLPEALVQRLNQVAADRRAFGIVRVWQLGEPTQNLAAWGGFEGETASGFSGGALALTEPDEALAGQHALRLQLTERQYVQIVLPFTPDGDGHALQPGETYTLSFWTRHDDVPPEKAARIGLASLDQDVPFSWVFLNLGYSGEWQRHVLQMEIGKEVPEGMREFGLLVGVFENGGTLWLDNVQLERKGHATLFTEDERDVAVGRVEMGD